MEEKRNTLRLRIAANGHVIDLDKIDSMTMNKAVGQSVKYFRKKAGLTFKNLSNKIYGNENNIGRLHGNESGLHSLTVLNLVGLCNALGITMLDLFNRCEIEYKRILED